MNESVTTILDYIEHNMDKSLTLRSLSAMACLSPFHFHRLFKKETGMAVKQFIEQIKMEKAYESILAGNESISDLAIRLGYNDYETFSRAFKKRYTISPDDLKSIVKHACAQVNHNEGAKKVIILTHHNFNAAEIAEKITQNLSADTIQLIEKKAKKVFVVTPQYENKKESQSTTKIKNKFNMTTELTMWNNILKHLTRNKVLLTLALLLSLGITPSWAQAHEINKDLTHFLDQKGYTAIPLQKYVSGHLYLEAIINDVKGRFILDSGAGSTVVDEKRKDKFKMIAEQTEEKATGAGGSGIAIQSSAHNKIIMGHYTIDHYTAMIINLDHVNNAFKQLGLEEVDGVIGADILTSSQAIIDYANMVLYLKK